MQSRSRITIIGAGIGGLVTAISCAQNGHDTVVMERAHEAGDVGAGIQLSPNATRILFRLGLKEPLLEAGFEPEYLEMRRGASGHVSFAIPIRRRVKERIGFPYLHIHRADLIRILFDAAKASGADISFGRELDTIQVDDTERVLSLSNGSELTLSEHDVLIGADGIRSKVKSCLFPRTNPVFTGQVAWRATLPVTDNILNSIPTNAIVWTGDGRHVVTYYLRNQQLLNFVGVVEQDLWREESWTSPGDPKRLKSVFSSFCPQITDLLESIEQCFIWALYDHPGLPTWTQGTTALLGDAAHPMPPFQAQGAAMAIEDAAILTQALSENGSPVTGLKHYQKYRQTRTENVRKSAYNNAKTFHLPTKAMQIASHSILRIVSSLLT